jgi:hypothetical protein
MNMGTTAGDDAGIPLVEERLGPQGQSTRNPAWVSTFRKTALGPLPRSRLTIEW